MLHISRAILQSIGFPYVLLAISAVGFWSDLWWISPITVAPAGLLLYRRHLGNKSSRQTPATSARLSILLRLPYRYQVWRPRHIRLVLEDFVGRSKESVHDDKAHLTATLDWLCLAQDVRDRLADAGGVSAGWSFEDGWLPSYPECTGFIVETFIDAADTLNRPDLVARAHRMIEWELTLQDAQGAFPGHYGEPGSKPIIFNTGQVMHGLLNGHLRLGRPDCLPAAVRAGWWLASQQDIDGCWRRSQHNDIPHTYDTRASSALLRAGLVARDAGLRNAALRQLHWALSQQDDDGWFANNAFTTHAAPFTHNIGYVIHGFLESGLLLANERYIAAARKSAQAVAELQRADGSLAGAYGRHWASHGAYCCLTGVAQMAINWAILTRSCGATEFADHARLALAYLKRHHRVATRDAVIRGGMAGSYPIWGTYERFYYPAWAAKFFADAIMLVGRMET